jgi:putative ABC transport system permease protein
MNVVPTDLRHALRALRRNLGFSTVALLSLGLGIGANSAIFTVVNAVLLRPLPYADADRLVVIRQSLPRLSREPLGLSAPGYVEMESRNRTLAGIAAFQNVPYELASQAAPERIVGARITPGLWTLLGLQPLHGRAFTEAEDRQRDPVVILSYGLWERRYGRNPAVLGQTILLDRRPHVVVGVMPRDIVFPIEGLLGTQPAALWTPMSFTTKELTDLGNNFTLHVIARLAPGVTLTQASTDLDALVDPAAERGARAAENRLTTLIVPLREQVVSRVRTLLLVFLGAIGLVLLVACANVANLLMARATGAQKEIAIRTALGATRLHLFKRFMAESLVLAVAGAASGLVLAHWGAQALLRASPVSLPRSQDIRLDGAVLLFALALCVATALGFGALSLLVSARGNVGDTLKAAGKNPGSTTRARRLRNSFVVAEIALALVLLVCAGLLTRSFLKLRAVDPGFRPASVMSVTVELPEALYTEPPAIRAFYDELARRLQAMPGAEQVGGGTVLPMASNNDRIFTPEGYQGSDATAFPRCNTTWTIGPYFETLGIPLVAGRLLTPQDIATSAPVVVVSQRIASRYWPGQEAIGKRLKYGPPQLERPWLTIVGVVGDVKQGPLDAETLPAIYQPYAQAEETRILGLGRTVSFAVRSATGDPAALASAIRQTVWSLDRQLAIIDLRPMTDVVAQSVAPRRFNMVLLGLFAITALVLASIGVYGVVAYAVTQRTREIGIRVALGASRSQIFVLVLRHGLTLGLAGLALGLGAAFAAGQLLSSLLFDVAPTDLPTLALVSAVILAVIFVATCVPALRAMRVDPVIALRIE